MAVVAGNPFLVDGPQPQTKYIEVQVYTQFSQVLQLGAASIQIYIYQKSFDLDYANL